MEIKFDKHTGLVPAIIQDSMTKNVLMLGYMNQEAFDKTNEIGRVTFYSRSKERLWTKGEESGNHLEVVSIENDCDHDTLLIRVKPKGPTCHTGSDTCWNETNEIGVNFLTYLEAIIQNRKENPSDESYTSSLFKKGVNKIAQKVGEEAVELVIESKDNNDELFLGEGADLLFHYLILLQQKGFALQDIISVLKARHSE